MSVFKRNYRPYIGQPTSQATRFGVLMRYSVADVWSSRITVVLFVLCQIPTLIMAAAIYIINNDTVKLLIAAQGGGMPNFAINERYFFAAIQGQCWMALVLTAWIGPRLVAVDLSNNALPTILAHPVSRLEYVLAKFSVMASFISAVTWIPILLLFTMQSYLSTKSWAFDHLHIAYGALAGCFIWITLLSLVALAVSSWVRWRIVATAMVFATIFVPAGMGGVFNQVMRTNWGTLINIPSMMFTLWYRLLHVDLPRFTTRNDLSTFAMLLALTAICSACAFALNARIRAREVVRG